MTLLQKIDTVFEWLYQNSGKNPTLYDLETALAPQGIDVGEIKDILAKLKNDNLIYCVIGDNRNAAYNDFCNYLISFDGKYFFETVKTFTEKTRRENQAVLDKANQDARMEEYAKLLAKWTRYLTYGTVGVAVGAVGLVIWEMWHFFHSLPCS